MRPPPPRFPTLAGQPLPDRERIQRTWPKPEAGPRLLFFSGGTALRETSRVLKTYTHNSIHLITPFDSGGSSAVLRQAFEILGIGDLRNRLLALADESMAGQAQVAALFAHRLPMHGDDSGLQREFDEIVGGEHALVRALLPPLREVLAENLKRFASDMPKDFDLRLANVGNLILAGGCLRNGGDIEAVLKQFSALVGALGIVRPVVSHPAHLVAIHEGGERTVGQHNLATELCVARGPIVNLKLTSALEAGEPLELEANRTSIELIQSAELIVFPIGSFFGSVLANLLPRGVGRTVLASSAPRVYVPNCGVDPEMNGKSVADCARLIAAFLGRDTGGPVDLHEAIDFVLVDTRGLHYETPLDLDGLREAGTQVLDVDLANDASKQIDPRKLSEVLLSLVS